MQNTKLKIDIGSSVFYASLLNNKTTAALKSQLPIKLNMIELNGNEKYARLPKSLPTNTENMGTIKAGDILLWQDDTLVLFYKSFKTSFRYTKIGQIENPEGLALVVGSGNVSVNFELK
ncbi:cyclophilin-like fold protein [Jiulongibacter sp. NS-SX5]|uniref:cyclophilin-like fold protein n=1 Tax=Jiulongibacter sp. NS-SX5 TaxID=3463854 RepID=UPI0040586F85